MQFVSYPIFQHLEDIRNMYSEEKRQGVRTYAEWVGKDMNELRKLTEAVFGMEDKEIFEGDLPKMRTNSAYAKRFHETNNVHLFIKFLEKTLQPPYYNEGQTGLWYKDIQTGDGEESVASLENYQHFIEDLNNTTQTAAELKKSVERMEYLQSNLILPVLAVSIPENGRYDTIVYIQLTTFAEKSR